MPNIRHLRTADYRTMPWKNGKGATTELAVGYGPDGAGGAADEAFAWRLSLADVPASGPFSDFAGYHRTIMMVEGDGMTLDFGPHGSAEVERCFEPVAFSGDWTTHCRLHGGAIRDLNLMVSRDRVSADVAVMHLESAQTTQHEADGGLAIFVVLSGQTDVALRHGAVHHLDRHETLLVENAGPGRYGMEAKTENTVLLFAKLRFLT